MKGLPKRFRLPLLVLAVFAIPGARLAWVVSRAEVGWDVVAIQWRDATLSWFVGEHRPVVSRSPAEQADFWLAEVERVVAREPASAELAMGAAWVLDQPVHALDRPFDRSSFPPPPGEYDSEELKDFHSEDFKESNEKCRDMCLRLARRATELEPGNRDWWRLRALLLFRKPFCCDEFPDPFDPDWQSTLADAAHHDADNALYDYLAAFQYWNRSARLSPGSTLSFESGEKIEVRDAEEFRRGEEHFERAVSKKLLAIGERSFPAVAEFLSRTSLPKPDQAAAAPQLRGHDSIGLLYDWQGGPVNQLLDEGRADEAVRRNRQSLRVLDQIEAAAEPGTLSDSIGLQASWWVADLRGLMVQHSGIVSEAELQKVEEQADRFSAFWEQRLLCTLGLEPDARAQREGLSALLAQPRLNTAVALLVPGALICLLSIWITRKQRTIKAEFGALRHAIAWGLGIGVVFLLVAYRAIEPLSHEDRAATPAVVSEMLRGNSYWQRFSSWWFRLPTYTIGACASLGFVAVWSIVRSASGWRRLPRFLFTGPAAKWAGPAACVSRSAVGLGGVLLLLYLLAAPDAVRVAEREFQQGILPVRDPAAYWAEFKAAAGLSESRVPPGQ